MSLKGWQRFELVGACLVLLALFMELASTLVEEDVRKTEGAILEARLQHIYDAARAAGKPYTAWHPEWSNIEEFYSGPDDAGDFHWRFKEVFSAVRPLGPFFFLLGAVIGLCGKWLEFRETNESDGAPATGTR